MPMPGPRPELDSGRPAGGGGGGVCRADDMLVFALPAPKKALLLCSLLAYSAFACADGERGGVGLDRAAPGLFTLALWSLSYMEGALFHCSELLESFRPGRGVEKRYNQFPANKRRTHEAREESDAPGGSEGGKKMSSSLTNAVVCSTTRKAIVRIAAWRRLPKYNRGGGTPLAKRRACKRGAIIVLKRTSATAYAAKRWG